MQERQQQKVINAYWHQRLENILSYRLHLPELLCDQRLLASKIRKQLPLCEGCEPGQSDQRLLASKIRKHLRLRWTHQSERVINAYWHQRLENSTPALDAPERTRDQRLLASKIRKLERKLQLFVDS